MTTYKLLIIFLPLFLICEMVILPPPSSPPPSTKCFIAGIFALCLPGLLLEFWRHEAVFVAWGERMAGWWRGFRNQGRQAYINT